MDTVKRYQRIIREVLTPFANLEYANADIRNELVCDPKAGHYLVVSTGWGRVPKGRIHGCLLHLQILAGKIWIQRDGTEDGIARDLEAAGIPKSDIVLAFHPPHLRQHTDYAAA
jgi:XisI protein